MGEPTIHGHSGEHACGQCDPSVNRIDAVDAILTEAARLAMLALETLKQAKLLPGEVPQWPLPRVRAATLLRCAATILDDLDGPR